MSVATIPGRISNTPMPCSASREAKRGVSMESAALERQYSARLVEAVGRLPLALVFREAGFPVHGFDVDAAADGLQAVSLAAQSAPEVVLLDWAMPGMDGLEVLRQIKSDPVLKVIPVVMLTSSKETQDVSEAYRAGVNMVMYALTGSYKADQVHLPAIVQRLTQ